MKRSIPKLDRVDHVHVYVKDRPTVELWYARILGLKRVPELEHWAAGDGPLFLSNPDRAVSIALFEAPARANRTTIAFRVKGDDFLQWRDHLKEVLESGIGLVDHGLAWSMYFTDPEGNPFEITSYEYELLKTKMREVDSV